MSTGNEIWDQFATLLSKPDYDGWLSLFSDDAVYIEPAGRHEGRAGIRAWIDEWGQALVNSQIETTRVVQEGGTIWAEWLFHCTLADSLPQPDGTVLPSGRTMHVPMVSILDVKDGKIVGARDYSDPLDPAPAS